MNFDLTTFLVAMLEAFLQCQEDGATEPASEMIKNRPIVRFAARRALQRQARDQGANRRERREFAHDHMADAIAGLEKAVRGHFKN